MRPPSPPTHPALLTAATLLLTLTLLGAAKPAPFDPAKLPPAEPRKIDFSKDIKPILATRCYACHGTEKQKSDYRLDLKSSALTGGSIGGAIIPGNAAKSLILQYVAGLHDDIRMPPKGERLTARQVGILRAWIEQGANWELTSEAATTQSTSWALSPLNQPPLPKIKNKTWPRNPIDHFILAKLEEKGMTPSPEADRRTLIRRVTFDLIGLPPTPQEVDEFLADTSADAYEKVVDRLLASPRYGERWARHWMDVVHFAETHGHDEDKPRPNAWPYRDYLIQSFNADKPYKRFVEEQVAGDVLYPDDPSAIVATGFLAAGPWDESSQMGIMDGTIDKQNARYLDRDDMLMTTMSTFVSATVHCARCHNHKFDPIPQTDYYALQAVFAGVDRIDRPYDTDPKIAAQRKTLQKQQRDLDSGAYPVAALQSDPVQQRVATWEKSQSPTAWTILDPTHSTSASGATLTKLADNSLLASGPCPLKDTYTITAPSSLKQITAIRLEVLTDDSLPHHGPGRQPENGNLHLSEFKIALVHNAATHPIAIARATADFDQEGWDITKSIDNNIDTAWGIHPRESQSHFAIFELKTPLDLPVGAQLCFTLDQLHGRQHVIGRLRLSATDAPPPIRAKTYPDNINTILARAADQRAAAQKTDLARFVLKEQTISQLAALPPPAHVYTIASDFPAQGNFKPAIKPRLVEVLRRGDVRQPIEPASPGALSCVQGIPSRFKLSNLDDEGARRAALAAWLTHHDNVLTWRSIVNRIWSYHFGRGIIDTPSDFGKMGAPPTHPELLDYLATTFRDNNGSIKQLHRQIVTSATYRQASTSAFTTQHSALPEIAPSAYRLPPTAYSDQDADNKYLWRMNPQRLDAEEIRDAILSVSGKLDLTMGGPSVKQFVESKGIHETPMVDYAAFDVDSPASMRRSVYRFVFRTIPDPFMQTLDCPDASQLTPKRETSVTALQALAMLNDKFVIAQSQHIANRLQKSSPNHPQQIQEFYNLALSRPATNEELTLISKYADKHGLSNTIRMLLNTNEFIFLN